MLARKIESSYLNILKQINEKANDLKLLRPADQDDFPVLNRTMPSASPQCEFLCFFDPIGLNQIFPQTRIAIESPLASAGLWRATVNLRVFDGIWTSDHDRDMAASGLRKQGTEDEVLGWVRRFYYWWNVDVLSLTRIDSKDQTPTNDDYQLGNPLTYHRSGDVQDCDWDIEFLNLDPHLSNFLDFCADRYHLYSGTEELEVRFRVNQAFYDNGIVEMFENDKIRHDIRIVHRDQYFRPVIEHEFPHVESAYVRHSGQNTKKIKTAQIRVRFCCSE